MTEPDSSLVVPSERTKGNGWKLKYGKFHLNVRNRLTGLLQVVLLAFSETVCEYSPPPRLRSSGILDLCCFSKIMESGLARTSAHSARWMQADGLHGLVWAELLQVVPDLILAR